MRDRFGVQHHSKAHRPDTHTKIGDNWLCASDMPPTSCSAAIHYMKSLAPAAAASMSTSLVSYLSSCPSKEMDVFIFISSH